MNLSVIFFYQSKSWHAFAHITFFPFWKASNVFLNLLLGHRAVYIGVHVPFSKESRRRHRHRGHKHHHRRREDKESDKEDGRESPSYGKRKLYLSTNSSNRTRDKGLS